MRDLCFLLYDNRSGSTLLSSLLNQFDGVSVSIETDVVYQILEYRIDLTTSEDIITFVDFLYNKTRFGELKLNKAKFESTLLGLHDYSKNHVLSAVIEMYFENKSENAVCWIIKGSGLYVHIPTLRRYYPAAKIIHIIRDGRAVFYSKMNTESIGYANGQYFSKGPMDTNVVHAARIWNRKLAIGEKISAYKVFFEELVIDTESVLFQILDYLEIPEEGRLITKNVRSYKNELTVEYSKIHTNVGSAIKLAPINKWKDNLNPEIVFIYEYLAKNKLLDYSYGLCEYGKKHRITFYANCIKLLFYSLIINLWTKIITLQSIRKKQKIFYFIRNKISEHFLCFR